MSNDNIWEEEDNDMELENDSNDSNGIKNLRAAKKANEKYIKQLEAQLGEYISKDYQRTVSEILQAKGVNAKAARLILNDLDEVNEKSVEEWLSNNGDLIGYQPKQESTVNQDNLDALKRQDSVTQDAGLPSNSEDIEQRLMHATSESEILSILNGIK